MVFGKKYLTTIIDLERWIMLNPKTEDLHKRAMKISDKAIFAKRENKQEEAKKHYLESALLEEQASYDRDNGGWHQPYSYSAAWLFISAGEEQRALDYIEKVIEFVEDKYCLHQLNEAKIKAKEILSYN